MYRFFHFTVIFLVCCLSFQTFPVHASQNHTLDIQTEPPVFFVQHNDPGPSFLSGQTSDPAQIQILNLDNPPDWLWAGAFLLPGLPQALLGNWGEGLAFFSGIGLSVGSAYFTHSELTGLFAEDVAILGLLPVATILLLASALGLYIWNIADAYSLNQKFTAARLPNSEDLALRQGPRVATAVNLRLWEF